MADVHDCKPAAEIIARLGGTAQVAAITGLDQSTIRRWRMPTPKGTGGLIPDRAKIELIDHARRLGVTLAWDDFKPPALIDTS